MQRHAPSPSAAVQPSPPDGNQFYAAEVMRTTAPRAPGCVWATVAVCFLVAAVSSHTGAGPQLTKAALGLVARKPAGMLSEESLNARLEGRGGSGEWFGEEGRPLHNHGQRPVPWLRSATDRVYDRELFNSSSSSSGKALVYLPEALLAHFLAARGTLPTAAVHSSHCNPVSLTSNASLIPVADVIVVTGLHEHKGVQHVASGLEGRRREEYLLVAFEHIPPALAVASDRSDSEWQQLVHAVDVWIHHPQLGHASSVTEPLTPHPLGQATNPDARALELEVEGVHHKEDEVDAPTPTSAFAPRVEELCSVLQSLHSQLYGPAAAWSGEHRRGPAAASLPREFAQAAVVRPAATYQFMEYSVPWGPVSAYEYLLDKGAFLGHGGYGDVTQCTVVATQQPCAFKSMRAVPYWKFQRESLVMKAVEHCPGTVKLIGQATNASLPLSTPVQEAADVNVAENVSFAFVFERVRMNSHKALRDFSDLTLRATMRKVLQAMQCVHASGVMHRDMKWENVGVDLETGAVTVIDFGLSEFYLPGRRLTSKVGSKQYKAPELLLGYGLYDYAVDMWSLGAMFADAIFCIDSKSSFFSEKRTTRVNATVTLQPANISQLAVTASVVGLAQLDALVHAYPISHARALLKLLHSSADALGLGAVAPALSSYVTSHNAARATLLALDLLHKLLRVDPSERLTATEALAHPYISQQ